MHSIETKEKLIVEIDKLKHTSLGFVPTMGALHRGHIRLIEQSMIENDLTIVSIFVNPTQFDNVEDLKNYPQTIDDDLLKLAPFSPNLLVFSPTIEHLYGTEIKAKKFDFKGLDHSMEGLSRPHHFQGVVTIVDILIQIIQPNKMYLGEKDFQQLQIIRLIQKQLDWKTQIIACPTVRESDGLAMSSRNMKLSQNLRIQARLIYQSLLYAQKTFPIDSINAIKQEIRKSINRSPNLKLDYFEIVDTHTLIPIPKAQKGKSYRGCVAVYADTIRLIDNIELRL